MREAEILRLGPDPLAHVLQWLDADSLATLCCTCRELRAAAGNPSLWKSLAADRWHHVHAAAFAGTGGLLDPAALAGNNAQTNAATAVVDWKLLFAEGNGWEPPRIRHTLPLRREADVLALHPLWLPAGTSGRGPGGGSRPGSKGGGDLVLALGTRHSLQIWHLSPAAFTQSNAPGAASAAGDVDGANGDGGGSGHQNCGGGSSNSNTSGHKLSVGSTRGCGGPTVAAAPVIADVYPLTALDGVASVTWITCGAQHGDVRCPTRSGGGRGIEPAVAASTRPPTSAGAAAAAPPPATTTAPPPTTTTGSAAATAAATTPTSLALAVGTRKGSLLWLQYDARQDSSSCRAVPDHLDPKSGQLPRGPLSLLNTTNCGSRGPLVELHLLPASGAAWTSARAGVGCSAEAAATSAEGGGGGILAALQRASSFAGGAGFRSAVQLYDVATHRHLSTVRDPFESHQFVCCRPVGGAAAGGAPVDPHVLLVGSVHGHICVHCANAPLPSLCSHKPRSATAALSTLDARCGGLTQRFGLQHCSLFPRLATSREHYVFTSHAGTSLEVYDRRAMSVPLYSRARLPRPPAEEEAEDLWAKEEEEEEEHEGHEGENEEEEEEVEYSAAPEVRPVCNGGKSPAAAGGWREGPAPVPNRHQGLWLEANDDVLLGRADNGTLWLWDLSTTLGWARGPDRSGLWHWMYEHGPLLQPEGDEAEGGGVWALGGSALAGYDDGVGVPGSSQAGGLQRVECGVGDHEAAVQPARRATAAVAYSGLTCLGSMAGGDSLAPMCVLASGAGPTTAVFSTGVWNRRGACAVGSAVTR